MNAVKSDFNLARAILVTLYIKWNFDVYSMHFKYRRKRNISTGLVPVHQIVELYKIQAAALLEYNDIRDNW